MKQNQVNVLILADGVMRRQNENKRTIDKKFFTRT